MACEHWPPVLNIASTPSEARGVEKKATSNRSWAQMQHQVRRWGEKKRKKKKRTQNHKIKAAADRNSNEQGYLALCACWRASTWHGAVQQSLWHHVTPSSSGMSPAPTWASGEEADDNKQHEVQADCNETGKEGKKDGFPRMEMACKTVKLIKEGKRRQPRWLLIWSI